MIEAVVIAFAVIVVGVLMATIVKVLTRLPDELKHEVTVYVGVDNYSRDYVLFITFKRSVYILGYDGPEDARAVSNWSHGKFIQAFRYLAPHDMSRINEAAHLQWVCTVTPN